MEGNPVARLSALADAITPWAIRVAATLGIADALAGGPRPVAELAAAAKVDPDALARVLRYLAARGVFTEPGLDVFALTELAAPLRSDHPAGRHAWLTMNGIGGRLDRTFSTLLDVVTTGRPGYPLLYGKPFWQDLMDDQDLSDSFDALMTTHAPWFSEVAAARDWSAAKRVVDVGGGSGALLAAILRQAPHLHGTLVDLPATIATAKEFLGGDLADRSTTVAGSFFDELPAGDDVYVLSNVLHDWSDADARRILARCAEAVPSGGRLLIVERIIAGQLDADMVTRMDLRMLVLVGGRERSADEYGDLAAEAGFRLDREIPTASGPTILECVR
ncbi:methyltransferase [Actinoplanes sp. NPDC048796]|uniref:methyltransferase n=1 Tax=unclassified Actinoplanes TaxID=2626549 RepID=UPI0033D7B585